MYLFAFATCYLMMQHINKKETLGITKEQFDSFSTWIIGGILLGARFGYVFFYKPIYFLTHPLQIIMPFTYDALGFHFVGISGMSYHGGLILAIIFGLIGIRRNKIPLWKALNMGFLVVPLGYTWGRLGNFINGELYGEITTSPIGMVFPMARDGFLLHHPSQLYEMIFKGVVLFGILYTLHHYKFFKNKIMALYLMGYGVIRFFIEFFRHPDNFLGRSDLFGMSRGQTLCSLMVIAGICLFIYLTKKEKQKD